MHAVILAAGPGVLVPPFPSPVPPSLLPADRTSCVLDVQLGQLADRGFRNVTVVAGRFASLLRAHLTEAPVPAVDVGTISVDVTGGPYAGAFAALGEIAPQLPPTFVVIEGGVLTDLPFDRVLTAHRASAASLTLVASLQEQTVHRPVLRVERNRLVGYDERHAAVHEVATGVFAVSRALVERFAAPAASTGSRSAQPAADAVRTLDDAVRHLLAAQDPPAVHRHGGQWVDLTEPGRYERRTFASVVSPGRRATDPAGPTTTRVEAR